MNKRGSMFVTAFVIAVALGIFILANSQTIQTQSQNNIKVPEQYAEQTANAIYESLQVSGTLGTYETAKGGLFQIDNGYWISYSVPNVPTVENTKVILSDTIKNIMNQYLDTLKEKQMAETTVTSTAKIENVIITGKKGEELKESDVFSGVYDDGFSVTAESSGSITIAPIDGESKTDQETDYKVDIDQWRFWYLFRKMSTWITTNQLNIAACNKQPEYGIRGNVEDCHYAPIKIETAKAIFDDEVLVKLQNSFTKDGTCIYGCPVPDEDCTDQKAVTEGTCSEDGFCSTGCGTPDPDCEDTGQNIPYCNRKDPYITCSYEFLCGDGVIDSEHGIDSPGPCTSSGTCKKSCKGGCEYENTIENCQSGACNDPLCPTPGIPNYQSLVPPCKSGEILFTAGAYTGNEKDPTVPITECGGVGTRYTWSLIAEITCKDTKYEQPISPLGFETLPFKIRVHQYFKERYHPPYINPCEEQNCNGGKKNKVPTVPKPHKDDDSEDPPSTDPPPDPGNS